MDFKQYFNFNKEQRVGLFVLSGLIIAIQFAYSFIYFVPKEAVSKEEEKWLAMQTEIDSLKSVQKRNSYRIYPFNPNFITDFKGAKLGMSVQEIDRLLAFRKVGKFANSAKEFQQVTGISDSLLATMEPYFKFPDWVNNKNNSNQLYSKSEYKPYEKTVKKIIVQDINLASKEDLMKVFGVGDAISERIIKQRTILGSFVSMAQMEEIWGLSPEVVYELNKNFKIGSTSSILKIDINNASTKELMKLSYFKYPLAREIVTYRSMNNGIKNIEDLIKIKGFPVEKVNIIALYLDF